MVVNGVDTDRSSPATRRTDSDADHPALIVHIGRGAPEKNRAALPGIQEALASMVDNVFALYGCADANDIGPHDSQRVRNLGLTDHVPDVLRLADALVLPSLREGLPGCVLEALASGVPVVASDLPGLRGFSGELPGITLIDPFAPPERWARALAGGLGWSAGPNWPALTLPRRASRCLITPGRGCQSGPASEGSGRYGSDPEEDLRPAGLRKRCCHVGERRGGVVRHQVAPSWRPRRDGHGTDGGVPRPFGLWARHWGCFACAVAHRHLGPAGTPRPHLPVHLDVCHRARCPLGRCCLSSPRASYRPSTGICGDGGCYVFDDRLSRRSVAGD